MNLRRLLRFILVALILSLVAGGLFVFSGSLTPTDATVQRHFITINLAEIPPGTARLLETTRGPIYVIHRTKEDLTNLDKLTKLVRDPESTMSIGSLLTRKIAIGLLIRNGLSFLGFQPAAVFRSNILSNCRSTTIKALHGLLVFLTSTMVPYSTKRAEYLIADIPRK